LLKLGIGSDEQLSQHPVLLVQVAFRSAKGSEPGSQISDRVMPYAFVDGDLRTGDDAPDPLQIKKQAVRVMVSVSPVLLSLIDLPGITSEAPGGSDKAGSIRPASVNFRIADDPGPEENLGPVNTIRTTATGANFHGV
jgi:hypothetical protein